MAGKMPQFVLKEKAKQLILWLHEECPAPCDLRSPPAAGSDGHGGLLCRAACAQEKAKPVPPNTHCSSAVPARCPGGEGTPWISRHTVICLCACGLCVVTRVGGLDGGMLVNKSTTRTQAYWCATMALCATSTTVIQSVDVFFSFLLWLLLLLLCRHVNAHIPTE